MEWKTDWLYEAIFAEFRDIWGRIRSDQAEASTALGIPPDSFCLQQCENMHWDAIECLPSVLHEWIYEGTDFLENAPGQTDKWTPGPLRGAFYSRTMIRFYVSPDRTRVAINCHLGPLYGYGYAFKVQEQDGVKSLIWDVDAGSWVS